MKLLFTIFRTIVIAQIIATLTVGQAIAQSKPNPNNLSPISSVQIRDLSGNENVNTKAPNIQSFSNKTLPGQEFSNIRVHVLGDVENPGIFSSNISERLSNVLMLAVPKRSSVRLVQLRTPGEKTRIFDLYKYYYQGDLANNPFLKENDVIFVPPHHGIVRIEGPVTRPGLYELAGEKNLEDIIKIAGGLSSAVSSIKPIKVVRFSEGGEKFVLNVNNSSQDLRSFKIMKGDIIIAPDIVNNPTKFDYTVESIPGENLFYPTATPNIFVMGAVNQAGSYPYKSYLRVKDYLAYAGPNPQARMNSVTLIRNGKRSTFRFDEKPIPGDILVVKSKVSLAAIVTAVSTVLTLTLTLLLLRDQLRK